MQRLAPGRPVDVLAHSLGARVALAALPHLAQAPGRMILLGAAEFERGRTGVPAARAPRAGRRSTTSPRGRTTSTTSMFETFAPRRDRGERAIGRGPGSPHCRLARPPARPRRRHGLDQRPGHPADRARGAALPLELLHPRRARWRSTRRSCGAGRAGTSPRCARRRASSAQEPRWSRLDPARRQLDAAGPAARARRDSDGA